MSHMKLGMGKFCSRPCSNNGQWVGNKIGYGALHSWVKRNLGFPEKCEHCFYTGLKGGKIHWANKSHKYLQELTDWIRLCASCHKLYDINKLKI